MFGVRLRYLACVRSLMGLCGMPGRSHSTHAPFPCCPCDFRDPRLSVMVTLPAYASSFSLRLKRPHISLWRCGRPCMCPRPRPPCFLENTEPFATLPPALTTPAPALYCPIIHKIAPPANGGRMMDAPPCHAATALSRTNTCTPLGTPLPSHPSAETVATRTPCARRFREVVCGLCGASSLSSLVVLTVTVSGQNHPSWGTAMHSPRLPSVVVYKGRTRPSSSSMSPSHLKTPPFQAAISSKAVILTGR